MVDVAAAARLVQDGELLAREAALASSRLGRGALGFCVIVARGREQAPSLAKAGAPVRGGPSLADALRSFFYDPSDIPPAQRDRWIDPLGAGLVPRKVARAVPVASYMKAMGVQRSLRCCVCIGGRMVAALGHAYPIDHPPTAAVRRALDGLARDFGALLRAHVMLVEATPARRPQEDPTGRLTRRQWQIARRVALGLSNAQIAAQLRLSPLTIKTVLERLYRETGTRGRVALARWLEQRA
ncbi:MAG TPA: LuxR C-terminal-related transcriptional regulator [Kofleriaceae bacterium]|nr:LuxR C-terminal-related transcriptional regulator [Kofleriaceae bacterium]